MDRARRLALIRSPAPLALMGLIYYLSAQSDLDTGLGIWDEILRTGAHFTVFGALAGLWWWTLAPLSRRALPIAALIAFLYALSDEYHQTHVPGRAGDPLDVLVDAAGILVACTLLRYHRPTRRARAAGGVGSGP